MASTEEEFTFSTTVDESPLRILDSPPLWHGSSASGLEKPEGKEVEDGERSNSKLPSFHELRGNSGRERNCTYDDEDEDEDEDDEKMDILWEDLNDDQFSRKQNSDNSSLQTSCLKGLKLSKANGQIVSRKKTSILVFIKVLKKIFLMHNSQHATEKSSW